jgi:MoaA/NifB/PqqE/SkfB family radical SAM enzyme
MAEAEDGGRLRAGDGAALHPLHLSPTEAPSESGARIEDYGAPLFVAWQLTNRCTASCLACCEESGPTRAWADELTREEALELGKRMIAAGVSYVAFGGGEPLGMPHCWELLELLGRAGVALKLETDGSHIDDEAADRLARLEALCVQVSVDGATAATHERVRPGSSFARSIGAIERLILRARPPQSVFVPNRLNIHEMLSAYEQAQRLGCEAFVTGPMMRIGRAAEAWSHLACDPLEWERAVLALRERDEELGAAMRLSIYPWDIVTELERRLESPQAMLLIVPNGAVKLLNALPFVVADLRRDSLSEAWLAYREGWKTEEVRAFVRACRSRPELLRYANQCWPLPPRA